MENLNSAQDTAQMTCLEHRMKWYPAPESGIYLEDLETLRRQIEISSCEEMPCWEDCALKQKA